MGRYAHVACAKHSYIAEQWIECHVTGHLEVGGCRITCEKMSTGGKKIPGRIL